MGDHNSKLIIKFCNTQMWNTIWGIFKKVTDRIFLNFEKIFFF